MKQRLLELLRRPRTWFIAVPALLLVVAIAGPFVWFRIVKDDPPPPLSFADVTTTTAVVGDPTTTPESPTATFAAPSPTIGRPRGGTPATAQAAVIPPEVEGPWRVGAGSISGYRIRETVGLTSQDAVGRTEKVSGNMSIADTSVTTGSWTVDMASVTSDEEQRDEVYRDNMAVERFPTSTFVLSEPVALAEVPANGVDITVPVKGALTLRGKTNAVQFTVKARRANNRVEVVGSIPVRFEDYDIPNPSNGYARTEDHGLVEFLLLFERA